MSHRCRSIPQKGPSRLPVAITRLGTVPPQAGFQDGNLGGNASCVPRVVLGVVGHAAVVGRWSGRVQTLLERYGNAIDEVKALLECHDKKLFDLAIDEQALWIVVESGSNPKATRANPGKGGEDATERTT